MSATWTPLDRNTHALRLAGTAVLVDAVTVQIDRLADLQLVVDDLHELLGDHLQGWIRQARLVDLLRKGQFDDLLHEASAWHARTQPMDVGPEWSRPVEDWVDDQPAISDTPQVRRQATMRTPTTRRKSPARGSLNV